MTERTITADATGRATAPAELATVEVAVAAEAGTAVGAHEAVRDRAWTVREAITEVVTAGDDAPGSGAGTPGSPGVGTSGSGSGSGTDSGRGPRSGRDLDPDDAGADAGPVSDGEIGVVKREVSPTRESRGFGEPEPPADADDAEYRAVERLAVDCPPETAGRVVVAAADAGGTVPEVRSGVHEATRRRLQDEALAAATERARGKAERVAAAEGLDVGGVRSVTTREVTTGMESVVDEAMADVPDRGFAPDPVAVSAGVEVVFDLVDG